MASFKIFEDQENIKPEIAAKQVQKPQYQTKRQVLGALQNKALPNVNKTTKASVQPFGEPKNNSENVYQKQPIQKPVPVVPVAQFEAFKVYEDQLEEKTTAKTEEITTKNNKNDMPKEVICDPKLLRPELENQNDESMVEERVVESPMSVDKSLAIKSSRQSSHRQERDIFFEIPDYRKNIHKYLREAEIRNRPKVGYMKKQPDITHSMRTILVDWLVEVAEEYRLQTETLYLAVSYIDRFLSYMSVVRAKLQLVGTAAMFIASKYEEIYPPDVGEFVYITDDTYNKKQVLRMEQLILKVLAFDLSIPTPLSFLTKFCVASEQTEKILHLAMYICELSMLEADPYLQFLPSAVAAASIYVARDNLEMEPWCTELEEATYYKQRHLQDCIKYLETAHANAPTMQQQAIQEKYKSSKFQHVSLLLPKNERTV